MHVSKQPRKQFEGMINVVRFNWPSYVLALTAIAVAGSVASFSATPVLPRLVLVGFCVTTGFFAMSSLAVSHLVYDRSKLYRWSWLGNYLKQPPVNIVNAHSGFDETSDSIHSVFPQSELSVVDFFQKDAKSASSIVRARQITASSYAAREVGLEQWGFAENSVDLVVLCFAAHEVRIAADRNKLFGEVARIVTPDGLIVLVEHLRDLPNFAAFGPGFMHFLPYVDWCRCIKAGGLIVREEFNITPFVRVMCLCRK